MKQRLLHRQLVNTVLATTLAGSTPLWADSLAGLRGNDNGKTAAEAGSDKPEMRDDNDVLAFRREIDHLESSEGAYAGALPEQLLSLGLALQHQGKYEEAATVFKRGVHLARISEGLYCRQQLPLLQGQITSNMAMGEYDRADRLQAYVYRVQTRSMNTGEAMVAAFMQQAQWQYTAFQRGLGERGYVRLMSMWDAYRHALMDIMKREGDTSPALLPPLHGMLRAEYLIAGFDDEKAAAKSNTDLLTHRQLGRFYTYRDRSYSRGQAIIGAIYKINLANDEGDEQAVTGAHALTMLGDWQMWHGRRKSAQQSYRQALSQLAASELGETHARTLFEKPVPLPDIDGLGTLPPTVSEENGDVVLQFSIDELGRVRDLSRLDDHEDIGANRLMRILRMTIFRPRFSGGQPVRTENIVKAFDIE